MEKITLYKFNRPNGGVTVSPVKPNGEYTTMVRLVADDRKMLTNDGEHFTSCVDVDSVGGWYEVHITEDDAKAEDYEAAEILDKEE